MSCKKMISLILAMTLALCLVSCGSTEPAPEPAASSTSTSEASSGAEESTVPDEADEPAESEAEPEAHVEDDDPLAYIGLSREEMKQVYDELNALVESDDNPANSLDNYDAEAADAYENECTKSVAEAHGISTDDVDAIFIQGVMGYFNPAPDEGYTLRHGEFLDATVTGTTLVIKAKIKPSMNNKLTISQNYYNVCDIIRDQGGDQFDEISYWAVADMTDGSEAKVVAFTVPKDVIQTIATKDFPDNTLGDYVDDLYILPSLRD